MKKVLLLSDIHIGSIFALFPKNFRTRQNNVVKLNEVQSHLLYHFNKFIDEIKNIGYDVVFLLGDLVDGLNPKQQGRFQMPCDYNEQIDACIQLLEPLIRGKKVFGVSGSPYHTSSVFETEKIIVENLNGEFLGTIKTLNYHGFNINIAHGVSQAIIYRLTLMDREVLFSQIAEGLDKIHKIDIFIRGHWHFAVYINYPAFGKSYVQVPCWQAFVPVRPYLLIYGRSQPDIGGALLFLDKKNKEINCKFFIYPNPKYHL